MDIGEETGESSDESRALRRYKIRVRKGETRMVAALQHHKHLSSSPYSHQLVSIKNPE